MYYHQSKDKRILPLLQAQLDFFERQTQISAGYKLDGTALETYSNIAFQAPVWCLFKVNFSLTSCKFVAWGLSHWGNAPEPRQHYCVEECICGVLSA